MPSTQGSVRVYVLWVFGLSVPFWILGYLFEIELLPGLPIGSLIAFTPCAAAAIMVSRSGQSGAIRRLFLRTLDLRRIKNSGWLLVFVLFNPLVAVTAYAYMRATGTEFPEQTLLTPAVVPLYAMFFIGALGEEIGWAGYATGPLLRRWGVTKAGLVLGPVWVVFHLIVLGQADRSIAWIAWWAFGTVSLRLTMTWLYAHGGDSVFGAAIFHAMINLCWQLFPVQGSMYDPMVFGLATLIILLLMVAARTLAVQLRLRAA